MARRRLTTRLNSLSAHHANRGQAHDASLVILLIDSEDPDVLALEAQATLAWEQRGVVIGPSTKVVLMGTCEHGPQ